MKQKLIYVTFQSKPSLLAMAIGNCKTEYYAVKCSSKEQAIEIAQDAYSLEGYNYLHINSCGKLSHKDERIIMTAQEYAEKFNTRLLHNKEVVFDIFKEAFNWMDERDCNALFEKMKKGICEDIEECADEVFNDDDVLIAIRRVLFKKFGIEE